MATKSFLNPSNEAAVKKKLKPFSTPMTSSKGSESLRQVGEFSHWLGQSLERRLKKSKYWRLAEPIALGSWARDELCPRSDIDILFVGDESAVEKLVNELNEEGLKLRYRVPEESEDWAVGVGPFDLLALLHAKPFFAETKSRLLAQQERIRKKGRPFARALLKTMLDERKERGVRYDSISNYLEPNIKYGPGGLRDLQQALYIRELFSDRFEGSSGEAIEVLNFYREFFLAVRQRLHVFGGTDVILAENQRDLAAAMGYDEVKKFTRDIQIGLSQVSFFADWVIEVAKSGRLRRDQVKGVPIKQLADAFSRLQVDDTVLMQAHVRDWLNHHLGPIPKEKRPMLGRVLGRYMSADNPERFFVALFRSRLLESCIPNLKKVKGLVQHDQYHRYTVDAHTLQAIRELLRVRKRPSRLGKLAPVVRELDGNDWKVLLWTCLYHDMAKGRGGSHSTKGSQLVKKDFTDFALSLRLTVEVAWMVENHLLVSQSAFRKNPQAPSTWKVLHDKGVKDKRLRRLAVFTAVDIMATNPDAWTGWKESLICELVSVARSPRATKFMRLLEKADSKKIKISPEFIRGLDPHVVESVPVKYLLSDYQQLIKSREDLSSLILRDQRGSTWVRFHKRQDQKGQFFEFTRLLYATGCSIQECLVQTYAQYGVYDWFKVKTKLSPQKLKKRLTLVDATAVEWEPIRFDKISVSSQDENECNISFRGRDQKGALLTAVKSLSEAGLVIRWARVHTWGRQIDDIFCVQKPENLSQVMQELQYKYQGQAWSDKIG